MAKPFVELIQVNYYLRLPGVADGIHSRRLRFDPWRLCLHVDGPEGVVTFSEQDDFLLEVLDLSLPLYLRINSPKDGWSFMDISEFINVLNLDYMSY